MAALVGTWSNVIRLDRGRCYTGHRHVVGDLLQPLNFQCCLDGMPIDIASHTVKFQMETDAGTAEVAETATGISIQPTQTFTASATTDLLTCNNHGLKHNDHVIVSNSGGALPTGLSASTRYYAVQVTASTFALAAAPDGPPIDITGAGTGTHSFYLVGSGQYDFSSGGVDTAGRFRAWITLDSGGEKVTLPVDEYGIPVELVALGN